MFLENSRIKNNLAQYLILILLSMVLVSLIMEGSKASIGFIVILIMSIFYCGVSFKIGIEKTNIYALYLIIFSIPFPYLISFMGKDAVTMTTIGISLLFANIMINLLVKKQFVRIEPKFALVMPILIVISLTVSFLLNPYFLGQSFRHYLDNISGILLYFVIILVIRNSKDVIIVIKIILITLILQSVISFLQWGLPDAARCFSIFGTRTFVPSSYIVEGFTRVTGTIWDYELLAEWFLLGTLLSLGISYQTKKWFYSFCFFPFVGGLIFTKTRSGIILLFFGIVFTQLLLNIFKKSSKTNSLKVVLLFVIVIVALVSIFPNQMDELFYRLKAYLGYKDLTSSKSINRQEVWDDAIGFFIKKPTIFGKGLYDVISFGYARANSFHSLYLTILYKIGIMGLIFYLVFWFKIIQHSLWFFIKDRGNKSNNWYIFFFLFCAFILMLVDEAKIEYLRYSHTIQFAWVIYALLIVCLGQNREEDIISENTLVSKTAV